ncbi:MAG: NAD-dependent epimerase/dehydratase family protein [Anaerolineales bacterium]
MRSIAGCSPGAAYKVARLRLANVYGPRDTGRVIPIFIHNALRGVPLTLYGGQQTIDFIWIGDAVRALLAAGFEDWPLDEAVNVGSGVGTPIRALAEGVLQATGSRIPIEVLPARSAEVVHFVAAVERLRALLPSLNGREPLAHLPEVVDYWRGRAT